MKKILLTLLLVVLLFGCAMPKYNYYPDKTEISEPPLNTVVTVYIGDNMLRQGKYSEHDAIYIRQNTKVGMLGSYTFTRGYYLKKGEDTKSEFYFPAGGPDSGQVIKSALADPFQVIRLDKNSGKLCGVSVLNLEKCTSKANYEKKKYPVASSDSFQQTLIYSGKVGNKINIGYREFTDDFARPAFNNDVEYDLADLYKYLPILNKKFLGTEPPSFNENSPSIYPERVVMEVLPDEVDSNKFQNAGFYLLIDIAPDDANLFKVPKQLQMK